MAEVVVHLLQKAQILQALLLCLLQGAEEVPKEAGKLAICLISLMQ